VRECRGDSDPDHDTHDPYSGEHSDRERQADADTGRRGVGSVFGAHGANATAIVTQTPATPPSRASLLLAQTAQEVLDPTVIAAALIQRARCRGVELAQQLRRIDVIQQRRRRDAEPSVPDLPPQPRQRLRRPHAITRERGQRALAELQRYAELEAL